MAMDLRQLSKPDTDEEDGSLGDVDAVAVGVEGGVVSAIVVDVKSMEQSRNEISKSGSGSILGVSRPLTLLFLPSTLHPRSSGTGFLHSLQI